MPKREFKTPEKVRERARTRYHADVDTSRQRLREKYDPMRARRYQLKAKFNLTLEEYDALLKAQFGVCAICVGGPVGRCSNLHVDHDHETGQVRGLLCQNCNTALGLMRDDPERMIRAAQYLRDAT